MGSMWSLSVDDFQLMSWKGLVPDAVVSLFQEGDRRVRKVPGGEHDEEEEITRLAYTATPGVVRDRLNVLGVTEAYAEQSFEQGLANEIEIYNGSLRRVLYQGPGSLTRL